MKEEEADKYEPMSPCDEMGAHSEWYGPGKCCLWKHKKQEET